MEESSGAPIPGGEEEQTPIPMQELLEDAETYRSLRPGDIVKGTIVRSGAEEILVDIGSKSEGIVASRELAEMSPEERTQFQVGQEIWAYVLRSESRGGGAILSLRRAQVEQDWQRAESLHRQDQIFEAEVADYNKGGVIIDFGMLRGFVPNSQLEARAGREGEAAGDFADLKGKKMRLKVIEFDRRRNRLILSERAAMREWRRLQKEQLLGELKEGEVRSGVVSGLADFGAFVDLGGADGLIHLSELSWRRISHPKELLRVGDEVQVYVLGVDREKGRISLSLKKLEEDPWRRVTERYREGQLVKGTITKLTDFGAFARLEDGVEGLIHISELAERRIGHPREVVQDGQSYTLRILRIEPVRHRIALSLRQVADGLDYVTYGVERPSGRGEGFSKED